MIIYYSIIIFAAFVALVNRKRDTEIPGRNIPFMSAFVVWAYIVFLVGMNSGFADNWLYISIFKGIEPSFSALSEAIQNGGKSIGWGIFQVFFKIFISSNYHVFFTCVALMQAIPIMNVLRRYSESYYWAVLIFILSLDFTWMMNGLRQFLAVAILFGCTPWIVQRRWLAYSLMVLLMSTVHFSALMMIPVYWCVTSKPWTGKVLLYILGIMFVAFFSAQFTATLEMVLTNTAYANATGQFSMDDGVHPLWVLMYSVPVLLSLVFRKQLDDANDPVVDLCVNMSVLTCGLYFIGVFTSGILIGRLPMYCAMYNYILYPYIFNHCFSQKKRGFMYAVCTLGYLSYFLLMFRNVPYYSDIIGNFR